MPSSVKDRFSNSWEYVYFFVKNKKYYFDLDAVREKHIMRKRTSPKYMNRLSKVPVRLDNIMVSSVKERDKP